MLPSVLFAYRTSKQSTTHMTPFYLTYGRNATLPTDLYHDDEHDLFDSVKNLVKNLPIKRKEAQNRITRSQAKQKAEKDRQKHMAAQFQIGDKVLLYDAARETQHSGKFEHKWKGPYYIHSVQQQSVYKLRTIAGRVLKSPYNILLLKPYKKK